MLIFVVLLLVAAGLVILYSTSAYNGQVKFHDPFHYLKKQGFATLLGLFGMALIARVDYHKWVPLAIPAYVTSIILSVAVIFFGDEYNGSEHKTYRKCRKNRNHYMTTHKSTSSSLLSHKV